MTPLSPRTGRMNSPGHLKTILTDGFEEMGVGFTRTKQGDAYWCVVFGKPAVKSGK